MTHQVDRYRLAEIKSLAAGPSANPRIADELTITAAVAYVAGEEILSTPECLDEDLTAFLLSWSADLADADRNALFLPLVADLVGAHRGPKQHFAQLCLSWLTADVVPAWLAAIGFDDAAARLNELPAISSSNLDRWSSDVDAVDRDAIRIADATVGRSAEGTLVFEAIKDGLRSTGEVAAGRTVTWAFGEDSVEARVAGSCARLCGSAQAILGESAVRRLKETSAADPVASAIFVVEGLRRARRDSAIKLVRRTISRPNLSVVAT